MSKSPNILLPVVGGIALVGGLAVASMYRNSGAAEIELLRDRVGQVEAQMGAAMQKAEAEATRAMQEAARAEEMAARIAEVQQQATATPAAAGGAPLSAAAPARDGGFGLGREALPEEVAAWDLDVRPDGRGLPEGRGDVWTGEEVFAAKCASCHGEFAEGVGNWPVLAGGFDTLARKDPVKTVGSYWPYLSTVWDYVHRSMPFGEAGTLTADETYAIVAYIIYSNNLVEDDFELSRESFLDVEMYNTEGFIIDDRPEAEYAEWRGEPCMTGCKQEVAVTMRSVFLVETPAEGGTNSVMNHARAEELPSFTADGPSFIPAAAPVPQPEAPAAPVQEASPASDDGAALVAAGEKVFRKCKACHEVGPGASNKSGPQLNGVIGRTIGSVEGFAYSQVFQEARDAGRVWDEAALAEFLADPRGSMKGTRMSFSGLRKAEDQAAIAAYLGSFGE